MSPGKSDFPHTLADFPQTKIQSEAAGPWEQSSTLPQKILLLEGESRTNERKGRGQELLPRPVREADSVTAEHVGGGTTTT